MHSTLRWLVLTGLVVASSTPPLQAKADDTTAVRQVVEAIAALTQTGDIAGLDTVYARDRWAHIIENTGVNHGWADYRDHHLKTELEEAENFQYRYWAIEPQVQ